MIWENTKLAFKAMFANKMRTILSLLGIIIGVASVVAILTLGNSATKSITDSINANGLDTVSLTITSGRYADTFNEQFGGELMKNVPGIRNVLPLNNTTTRIRFKKEIKTGTIYGVSSDYATEMNLEVAVGEFFTPEDNISKRQVVVLGSDIAEDLFPDGNAVGQYVSIFRNQSKRYLVVGVLEEKDLSLSGSYNSSMFIPYNTYTQKFRRTTFVGSYSIKVEDGYDSIEVSDAVNEYLDNLVGSDSFVVFSSASLAEMAGDITKTFSTFLACIAGISLLVGGIGIMNIMLVSVAERTKEIGIRKALGASPRVIRGQFITEAIVLTVVGGLIGIGIGTWVSKIITNIAGWSLHVSLKSYALSMGFSMFIGVFFGWYPAKKASKLDPIVALNYE